MQSENKSWETWGLEEESKEEEGSGINYTPNSRNLNSNATSQKYAAAGAGHIEESGSDSGNEMPMKTKRQNISKICKICHKKFRRKQHLDRHTREMHRESTSIYECGQCQQHFKRKEHLTKHETACEKRLVCTWCGLKTLTKTEYKNHRKICPLRPSKKGLLGKKWEPSLQEIVTLPKADPVTIESTDLTDRYGSFDKIIATNWQPVRTAYRNGKRLSQYNFRLTNCELNIEEIKNYIRIVHKKQRNAYKYNIAFSLILAKLISPENSFNENGTETDQKNENEIYRFFYASCNNHTIYFPVAQNVNNTETLEKSLEHLNHDDLTSHILMTRPSTGWYVKLVVSMRIYIYNLTEHVLMGFDTDDLPEYILNNKNIIALQKNSGNRYYKSQKLCLFRCISYHLTNSIDSETFTKQLFQKYCQKYDINMENWEGLDLMDLHKVEKLFSLRIWVFHLDKDEQAILIRQSMYEEKQDWDLVNLNLHGQHLSYITNITQYARSWRCISCRRLFKQRRYLQTHEPICSVGQKIKYPGCGFCPPYSIIEELRENVGLDIDMDHQTYMPCACLDIETYSKRENIAVGERLTLNNSLEIISIAANSSVKHFDQPVCWVVENNDVRSVVRKLVEYLLKISDTVYANLRPKYQYIFDALLLLRDMDGENDSYVYIYFDSLIEKLESWLRTLPVYSYNGGKFDIPVLAYYLLPLLKDMDEKLFPPIKRGNWYISLRSPRLAFLDALAFLAAGTSYAQFLRAFQIPDSKSAFPHKYLDNPLKLKDTQLPPIKYFNSDLSMTQLSQTEYDNLQKLWHDKNFKTLEDLLIYYNKLDCKGFIGGLEKMAAFWKTAVPNHPISLHKDGLSLSGLAYKLMKTCLSANTFIPLASIYMKPFWDSIRQRGLVGGASVVWRRVAVADETIIREHHGGTELCGSCLGVDANSLYGFMLTFPMATGVPLCWKKDETKTAKNYFTRSWVLPPYVSYSELEWLVYMAHQHHAETELQHYFFLGQTRIGQRRIRLDGAIPSKRIGFSYLGCRFHAHKDCKINFRKPFTSQLIEEAEQRTDEDKKYIEEHGWQLIEKHECEWRQEKRDNEHIRKYLADHIHLPNQTKTRLSEQQILEGIKDGTMFGIATVDLTTPAHLLEYFYELCPLYRHASNIQADQAGPLVAEYCARFKIEPPKKIVVGVLDAKEHLVASEMLRYLLQLGMVVTKLHSFVQFYPKTLFAPLMDTVTHYRRQADSDPSMYVLGLLWKLIGNSFYGKTIQRYDNRQKIKMVSEDKLSSCINEPLFQRAEQLDNNCYEITSKYKTVLDLAPTLCGFLILQYSKLHMLRFYYSFLDVYWDRKHWELVLTDTDSYYISISTKTFEEFEKLVRPEKLDAYKQDRNNWLTRPGYPDDNRVLGLFKTEWYGDGLIAAGSKAYYGFRFKDDNHKQAIKNALQGLDYIRPIDHDRSNDKYVLRGVKKRMNQYDEFHYIDLIIKQQTALAKNRGFQMRRLKDGTNKKMYKYEMIKKSFQFEYFKRFLNYDSITTEPLPMGIE